MHISPFKKTGRVLAAALFSALLSLVLLQTVLVPHGFAPRWPLQDLTQVLGQPVLGPEEYRMLFQQTGLGPPAIQTLRADGADGSQAIRNYQTAFFASCAVDCSPLVGGLTREDLRVDGPGPAFVSLQPGDILVTLSTHSFGWRHGHAALVLDSETALESQTPGTASRLTSPESWRNYANYAVLRFKGSTATAQAVAAFARKSLLGLPYGLHAGLLGEKAPVLGDADLPVQCAYLVWYAWQVFGADLDSDGGRLVTPRDLLASPLLEVVQVCGLDPRALE